MAITEKYASSAGAGSKDGSSEANAWDWETMLKNASAGDRVNFKGNHTLTDNAAFTNAGTTTSPLILRGYASTIGDGYQGRTNDNGPLIKTNFGALLTSAYSLTMPNYSIIEAISVVSSKNGSALTTGSNSCIVRCYAENSGTGSTATGISVPQYSLAWDSDAVLSGGSGGSAAFANYQNIISCRGDGGPAVGCLFAAGGTVAAGCTFYSSGLDAVRSNLTTASNYLLYQCTIVSSSSDGFQQGASSTRLHALISCLIADNSGYGINGLSTDEVLFSANNRLDRNTSGASTGATDWLAATGYSNNTTSATQANEFPGYASNDYRLGRLSPARKIGIPLYMDVGALDRIEDYPDPANVTSSDTTDGQTGTHTCSGGSIWMPRARQIGV